MDPIKEEKGIVSPFTPDKPLFSQEKFDEVCRILECENVCIIANQNSDFDIGANQSRAYIKINGYKDNEEFAHLLWNLLESVTGRKFNPEEIDE